MLSLLVLRTNQRISLATVQVCVCLSVCSLFGFGIEEGRGVREWIASLLLCFYSFHFFFSLRAKYSNRDCRPHNANLFTLLLPYS